MGRLPRERGLQEEPQRRWGGGAKRLQKLDFVHGWEVARGHWPPMAVSLTREIGELAVRKV